MAGLLDFLDSDEGRLGLGLLMAGGQRSDGAGFGQRISEGMQYAKTQKDNDGKRKFQQAQIDNYASEIEARKLATIKDQRAAEQAARFMGGGGPSSGGGGMPSNGGDGFTAEGISKQFGIPIEAVRSDYQFNGGKKISELISERSKPNWQNINGNLVNTNAQGFGGGFQAGMAASNDGKVTAWQPDGRGGVVVGAPRGALETFGAYEGVKSGLGAAARVNLRENADGTKSPVSEFDENPRLRSMLGGGPVQPGYATEPQMKATVNSGMGPDPKAIQREIKAVQNDLFDPSLDEASKKMLRSHLADLQSQASDPRLGAQTAPTSRPGAPAYGMTNDQVIANKVAEEKALGQVKADITSTDSKVSKYESATDAIKVINKALNHPGLSAATGLQGKIDPRNYMPGTDAKDFEVMREQMKGGAFLTAYKSLQGGGAIATIEGEKAEAAVARLNKAQSTAAFTEALNDYKEILERGMKRAGTTLEQNGLKPSNEVAAKPGKTIVKTGMYGGKRVVQYSDGSTDYAN